MLDAGVHLPCSAFEAWFVSAALDDAFGRSPTLRSPRPERRPRKGPSMPEGNLSPRVVRHGEVHNPTGILYGRLPDSTLSRTGAAQAAAAADVTDRDIVASPLCSRRPPWPIAARQTLRWRQTRI